MRTLVYCLGAALLFACSTPTPMTTWPYSSWGAKNGMGSLGEFRQAQQSCLAQLGISDPASVARNSPTEDGYVGCMNSAGWCSEVYHCDKPGAS